MKLAVVGVGNAGCRIANRIRAFEQRTRRTLTEGNALLVNTEPPAFDTTAYIGPDRHLLIGDVYPGVDGGGVDGDPDLGAEVAREDRHELIRAFDHIALEQVDGVLVVAGLGRGTGGGAGAVVLDELGPLTDLPIYALAVLPGADEGPTRAMNAARALQSFVEEADNVIGFDNGAWRDDEGTDDQDYSAVNAEIAKRVVTLFAAGEQRRGTPSENRLDPSDIIRTLATGGISSIGYASTPVAPRSLLGRWLRGLSMPWQNGADDEATKTDAAKINNLVRRAAKSKLTLPCEVESAERALILLSGPSRELSRKGFESGRYWLEREADIVEVKAGDEPHERARELVAVVLFSNVTDVPRIEAMKAQAVGG